MSRTLLLFFRLRTQLVVRRRRRRRDRLGALPPNVDQINDQLYVGGCIDREDWQQLFAQGITVDVNLQAERLDDFGAAMPDAYLWLPTMDYTSPSPQSMRVGVAFIQAALREGKRVLIHCHAGRGRS